MRMLPLMPKLKTMLVLPVDRPLLKLVEGFMYNCASEVENKILTTAADITSLELDAIASDSLWLDGEGRNGEADKGEALKVAAEARDSVPVRKNDDKHDAKHGIPQLPSTKDRVGSGAAKGLLVAKSLENIYDVSPRPARRITTSISAPSNVANELITGIRKSRSSVDRSSFSGQGGSAGRRRDSLIKARLRHTVSDEPIGSTGGGVIPTVRRTSVMREIVSPGVSSGGARLGSPRLSASTSEDSGLKVRHRSSRPRGAGSPGPPATGLKPRSPKLSLQPVSPRKPERRHVVRLPANGASRVDPDFTKVVTLPPIRAELDGTPTKSKRRGAADVEKIGEISAIKKSSRKRTGVTRPAVDC